jgi:hypothetical protein
MLRARAQAHEGQHWENVLFQVVVCVSALLSTWYRISHFLLAGTHRSADFGGRRASALRPLSPQVRQKLLQLLLAAGVFSAALG